MIEPNSENKSPKISKHYSLKPLLIVLAVLAILAGGTYFRTIGVNWDANRHLHPDERFLSMVLGSISPVKNLSEYFDTSRSTLNPGNVGYDFFVYGTLPIFIVRYVGEWVGQTGYDLITIVGRELSAYADILTILLVFLIGYRVYKWQVGLIAAALYAFAVLPIQQSHFMTVDTFTNTFGMLTVFAGVLIATKQRVFMVKEGRTRIHVRFADIWPYVVFGIGLGMATASKINAVSLALMLVIIEVTRYLKSNPEEREQNLIFSFEMAALAAVISFFVFRCLQPYAFTGPSFFNFSLNQKWLDGLKSLQAQSAGQVDFPPALQWARRPITFSLKNLILWGIGLPFGLAAIISYIAMGVQIFKRHVVEHLPIWAWTGVYFLWQALSWVKSMRYQLLIYPLLAIIAGWGLVQLWQSKNTFKLGKVSFTPKILRIISLVFLTITIVGTGVYAFAFTRIYTRPQTRIAATDWIYENIPGPVNIAVQTADGPFIQQEPYRSADTLWGNQLYDFAFKSESTGFLKSLTLSSVTDLSQSVEPITFSAVVRETGGSQAYLSQPSLATLGTLTDGISKPAGLFFQFDPPIPLTQGQTYVIEMMHSGAESQVYLSGVPVLEVAPGDGSIVKQYLPKIVETITQTHAYNMEIGILKAGSINSVELPFVLDQTQNPEQKNLKLTLTATVNGTQKSVSGQVSSDFLEIQGNKGTSSTIILDEPLTIPNPQNITFNLELVSGEGQISISSVGIVHESSWDDALPVSKEGYVPYSDNGGIFRGDLNLELYWPDDQAKKDRFLEMLSQADYVSISSDRQWGTTTRIPERYPLTSLYYRDLLGCPKNLDLVTCYNNAEPSMYQGNLGFELVKTETSYPNLGSWQFNDQFAEEAFTVYDHPKVLIFKKTEAFDIQHLKQVLDSVDLTRVVNITAKQADTFTAGQGTSGSQLMLSDERLAEEQAGGTWALLFDRNSLVNKNPALAVLLFYLFSTVLGLLVFPIVRIALPGLDDKGYPFSRLVGFLLLAWLVFILGSAGVAVTRGLILGVVVGIALMGTIIAWYTRTQLMETFKQKWKQYLLVEIVGLAAFAMFLWIRYQNPDLWHPWRGGEKPMDFSYLNAVIKSTNFPAYDPWFAGGYINYYYYGQVIVGIPIKLLGIIPAIAYNIILPIWYSLLIMGAFSIGWNLAIAISPNRGKDKQPGKRAWIGLPFWAGLMTAALLAFLGNLGEVKLLSEAFRLLGSGGQAIQDSPFTQQLSWFFKGLILFLKKTPLPVAAGTWYWNPSRVIPGDPITEFPFFTFLYADLHAHLIAMPIAVLSVGWGLSTLLSKGRWSENNKQNRFGIIAAFFLGALAIGALKPTNTWDFYTFLILNLCVLGYVGWRYVPPINWVKLKPWIARITQPLIGIILLALLSSLLYQPFNSMFHPGYSQIGFWQGDQTPISSYITHWGLPLFIIFFWFAWETYQWMAVTPVSALRRLEPYKQYIVLAAVFLAVALIAMLLKKIGIAVIALPFCVWALILVLRPDQSDAKRLAFFMIGTGMLLTIVVELVYLVGDIGRMNVVFKLYLQAWLLMTLALGVGLVSLWQDRLKWTFRTQTLFQIPLILLIAGTLLFPVLGTLDKITDRMDPEAPHTLDGMKYMETSVYNANGKDMNLVEDYHAIQWMQDNVQGSPVILEAQAYEYLWGNRYTIYTGLPGVVGWNYHQRQQRAVLRSEVVQQRVDNVNAFYQSTDLSFVKNYLKQYKVSYIIVGQLEHAFYEGEGLSKFEVNNGILWDEVYRENNTVIYKVR